MTYTLTDDDLARIVRLMPKHMRSVMKKRRGLFMGGGAIRAIISGETINDWDLFGPSEEELDTAISLMRAEMAGDMFKSRLYKTDNAITLLSPPRTPIQAITRWLYNDPVALIASFDFTVARAIVWWDSAQHEWCSLVDERFYADLAAKRLHYCRPIRDEDAGGSMMRVMKFLRRGYNISPESLAAVMARITDRIEWHQIGDKVSAEKVIAGLLREVDPLVIIDGVSVEGAERVADRSLAERGYGEDIEP